MKNNSITPESVKTLVGEEKINGILDAVYFRISSALTQTDLEKIAQLDAEDSTGEKAHDYISRKVPNVEEILKEEVDRYTK